MNTDLNKNAYLRITQSESDTFWHLREGYQKTLNQLKDKDSDYANQLAWIIEFYEEMYCRVRNHISVYEESTRNG